MYRNAVNARWAQSYKKGCLKSFCRGMLIGIIAGIMTCALLSGAGGTIRANAKSQRENLSTEFKSTNADDSIQSVEAPDSVADGGSTSVADAEETVEVSSLGILTLQDTESNERSGETGYDTALSWLRGHKDLFSENQIRMSEENPEYAVFLYRWKTEEHDIVHADNIILSKEEQAETIPLFEQWDERWGYQPYGDAVIGTSGCGPVCLSMVAYGLLRDNMMNPAFVAAYAMNNGWYLEGTGTKWGLFEDFSNSYGLICQDLDVDQQSIRSELYAGHPVICSMEPGDFTYEGHFIVLTSFDGEDNVTVNDPVNLERSGKKWNLDKISGQIRHAWSFGLFN